MTAIVVASYSMVVGGEGGRGEGSEWIGASGQGCLLVVALPINRQ